MWFVFCVCVVDVEQDSKMAGPFHEFVSRLVLYTEAWDGALLRWVWSCSYRTSSKTTFATAIAINTPWTEASLWLIDGQSYIRPMVVRRRVGRFCRWGGLDVSYPAQSSAILDNPTRIWALVMGSRTCRRWCCWLFEVETANLMNRYCTSLACFVGSSDRLDIATEAGCLCCCENDGTSDDRPWHDATIARRMTTMNVMYVRRENECMMKFLLVAFPCVRLVDKLLLLLSLLFFVSKLFRLFVFCETRNWLCFSISACALLLHWFCDVSWCFFLCVCLCSWYDASLFMHRTNSYALFFSLFGTLFSGTDFSSSAERFSRCRYCIFSFSFTTVSFFFASAQIDVLSVTPWFSVVVVVVVVVVSEKLRRKGSPGPRRWNSMRWRVNDLLLLQCTWFTDTIHSLLVHRHSSHTRTIYFIACDESTLYAGVIFLRMRNFC